MSSGVAFYTVEVHGSAPAQYTAFQAGENLVVSNALPISSTPGPLTVVRTLDLGNNVQPFGLKDTQVAVGGDTWHTKWSDMYSGKLALTCENLPKAALYDGSTMQLLWAGQAAFPTTRTSGYVTAATVLSSTRTLVTTDSGMYLIGSDGTPLSSRPYRQSYRVGEYPPDHYARAVDGIAYGFGIPYSGYVGVSLYEISVAGDSIALQRNKLFQDNSGEPDARAYTGTVPVFGALPSGGRVGLATRAAGAGQDLFVVSSSGVLTHVVPVDSFTPAGGAQATFRAYDWNGRDAVIISHGINGAAKITLLALDDLSFRTYRLWRLYEYIDRVAPGSSEAFVTDCNPQDISRSGWILVGDGPGAYYTPTSLMMVDPDSLFIPSDGVRAKFTTADGGTWFEQESLEVMFESSGTVVGYPESRFTALDDTAAMQAMIFSGTTYAWSSATGPLVANSGPFSLSTLLAKLTFWTNLLTQRETV